jgi:hypothetical protein
LIDPDQLLLCLNGKRMSTLDEIAKEKQRIGEALARIGLLAVLWSGRCQMQKSHASPSPAETTGVV